MVPDIKRCGQNGQMDGRNGQMDGWTRPKVYHSYLIGGWIVRDLI